MSLPDLSHLQFAVLEILRDGSRSGKFVRSELDKRGIHRSGPMFYQIMARLEDASLVKGWYESKEIDGVKIRERTYELTSTGLRAINNVRDFYGEFPNLGLQG